VYQVGINKGIILRCTAYQISRVVKSVIVIISIIIIIIIIAVVIVIVASDLFGSGVVRLAATKEDIKFRQCATLLTLSCYHSNQTL